MLKNKLIVSLVLIISITGCISLQSKQIRSRQPIQQTPPQAQLPAQPLVQQPVQPRIQQKAQPARAQRQARQQRRQPRQQTNRRNQPRQTQQRSSQPQAPQAIQQQAPIQPVQPPVQQPATTQLHLSNFDFGAGSVLPTFINQNGTRYLILSREAHGNDKGTYDDFGGKRDYIGPKINQKKEAHPVITASREFFEEAILMLSIGMSLPDTKKFIDVDNIYTEYVIAYGHNVTYITDFTLYADRFFSNFYNAFNTTTSRHSKEKDRIAIIEWNTLKAIVNNTPFNSGVVVDAQVLNPLDQKWYTEKITLRGFFVKKLRPFWMDKLYLQGKNNKIRFY
jgi:hypothetical protein